MRDSVIDHAIVGLRSNIEANCTVRNSMLIGADYYESDEQKASVAAAGGVPLGIGANSTIENCIVDKNARIGSGVSITNREGVQEATHEKEGWYIRSGIVIVARNTTIPNGTVI